MSEKKHTPEPWAIGEYNGMTTILGPDGTPCHRRGLAEAHASQARATACVNACAGINPAAVPVMVEALKVGLDRLDAIAREQGKRRSNGNAARAIRKALQLAGVTP